MRPAWSGKKCLPQPQPICAEFAFDLQLMIAKRHSDSRQEFFAEKHFVARLHIQQFNGENISRVLQFIHRENQRRKMSDRKSTRLNSSHLGISYAVFCLKKK